MCKYIGNTNKFTLNFLLIIKYFFNKKLFVLSPKKIIDFCKINNLQENELFLHNTANY